MRQINLPLRTLFGLAACAACWISISIQSAPFPETNWARSGTASQSSDHMGAVAGRAIDGNTSLVWSSGSISHTEVNQPDDPPWWEVDLGATKRIGRVSIWLRVECCQNRNDDFTTIVLDENRAELSKKTYPGRPPSNVTYDFATALQGRYLRIEGQTPRTTGDGVLSLAEVEVIAPYEGLTLNITKQPDPASVAENQIARFGPVTAAAIDVAAAKFRFQWQKNGQDIPGATAASYTTPVQKLSDNGAEYSVNVSLPGIVAASAKAKLTVTSDAAPPRVGGTAIGGGAQLQFQVNFSELMDPASTTNKASYVFGGGASVLGVELSGPTLRASDNTLFNSAVLSVAGISANSPFTLAISGVKDLAGNAIVATNLTGTIGFYEVNHARAGVATQSSDLDTVHTAVLAIDGKTDGAWGANTTTHTRNSDDPPWWEVDLGAAKPVARVSVWFRTDCCQNRNDDFTLIVLGPNRTELARRQYAGRPPRNVAFDLNPVLQAQYVRIEGQTPRTTSDGYQSLTEVEVIAPYANASINVTKGPADVSGLEARTATFGPVTAEVVGAPLEKVAFQWQKNGEDIAGATQATYTTPVLALADNGSEYSVKLVLPGIVKVSPRARLTVAKDSDPPHILSVEAVATADKATFVLSFSELMDTVSAETVSNYSLGAGVTVAASTLSQDRRAATLTVTGLGATTLYALAVTGVKDAAGNALAPATIRGTVQVNHALTGIASQSSDLNPIRVASLAIDGDTNAAWGGGSVTHTQQHGATADDPPVWEVDLGGTKKIGSVRIFYRSDCCQNRNDDVNVFVLDASRSEVTRRKHPGRPANVVLYNFAPAVQGQFVRIHGQAPRTTSDGFLSLAEVQVFSPYETETIAITGGLSNLTAVIGKTATLGPVEVNAPAVPPSRISYQWLKNGVEIAGALSASYTTPVLAAADDGAEYSVRALLPGIASEPAKAILAVKADTPAAEVRLAVSSSATGLRIAWPQAAAGYALEFTESLSPAAWKPAPEAVLVLGAESYVTLTSQAGTRFYRLVKR